MLAIPPTLCPEQATVILNQLQREVNEQPEHKSKVQKVEAFWANRTRNNAFSEVRFELLKLCPGGYCCYCETNEPSPVEHIWPKSHYPERAFTWENYLFACHNCNSHHKGAKWAIFQDATTNAFWREVDWELEPPTGEHLFIDLRQEDPQDLIRLDFDTFWFEANTGDARQRQRVEYTLNEILKLNERGFPAARGAMYDAFVQRLNRLLPLSSAERQKKAERFQGIPQRTVWKEMQRWHQRIPELKRLFDAVPEALTW
jgi:uncharacterized protein (TIGR02646 family)